MPKLRQPRLLRSIAYDVLVDHAVECCDGHSMEYSLRKLRRCVAFIKENICASLPRELLTDFCNQFLKEFYWEERPASHSRAVLKMIMDSKISELMIQDSRILDHLNPSDSRRLRGLEILYVESSIGNSIPINLKNIHLADLTELNYLQDCNDADLGLIGKNCTKLKKLGIQDSKRVTDRGIRALNRLSELRCIFVAACPKVSLDVIYELLIVHKKLEQMFIYLKYGTGYFSSFFQPKTGLSVFPSIKGFAIPLECYSSDNLWSIALMFPNLESMEFCGHVSGDLRIFETLKNLSLLDFTCACGVSWVNLKQLLSTNGSNITELRTGSAYVTQDELDTIFKYCTKIETLVFSCSADLGGKVLFVPPFRKLKTLQCFGECESDDLLARLEFGKMSRLRSLLMDEFYVSTQMVQEMILDNNKFPKLQYLSISEGCDIDSLNKIIKYRNLDIRIMKR